MSTNISKSNPRVLSTLDRLEQVQMGSYDRLIAEAHLARAEAIAEFAARGWYLLVKAVRTVFLRPYALKRSSIS